MSESELEATRHWLGWAERRLPPELARYIPRELLPAPTGAAEPAAVSAEGALLQALSLISTLSATLTLVADAFRLADEGQPIPMAFLRERVMKSMERAAAGETLASFGPAATGYTVAEADKNLKVLAQVADYASQRVHGGARAMGAVDLAAMRAARNPVREHVKNLLAKPPAQAATQREHVAPSHANALNLFRGGPLAVTQETMDMIEAEKKRLGVDSAAAVLQHHLKNARQDEEQ